MNAKQKILRDALTPIAVTVALAAPGTAIAAKQGHAHPCPHNFASTHQAT